MEGLTKWSSVAQEVTDEKGLEEDKEAKGVVEEALQQAPPEAESQGSSRFFSSFSNMVNKVAVDATSAFKDKVGNASMISEFNREQEEFIKSRGLRLSRPLGTLSWVACLNSCRWALRFFSSRCRSQQQPWRRTPALGGPRG